MNRIPNTQLRYQDARTRTYLGSPSLVRLATHDYFDSGSHRQIRLEHMFDK